MSFKGKAIYNPTGKAAEYARGPAIFTMAARMIATIVIASVV